MAARVTPAEIIEMHRLYNELGNAAEVARRMKRGASTVRRYINMKDVPTVFRIELEKLFNKA